MAHILKRGADDVIGKTLSLNTWMVNSLKYNSLERSLSDYEEGAQW